MNDSLQDGCGPALLPARDTAWFASRRWGVFCHYLGRPEMTSAEWNMQVDAFDTARLAAQLRDIGAPYFFFTIGQGSGHYCAPNATYDRWTALQPSKCSRRDLVSDLAEALDRVGIPLLVYISDGPFADRDACRGLGLTDHWEYDKNHNWWPGQHWAKYRLPEFQCRWEEVCRDWSLRFGRKVRGWWVDGAYAREQRFPEDCPPNLRTYAEALRAGNPDALVSFNPGIHVPVIAYSEHEDFTAGEIGDALPECKAGFLAGPGGHQELYHILSYLGKYWSAPPPRFPDELVIGYTRHVISKGGVMTWDVPIQPTGLIPPEFANQLQAIGNAVRRT